MNIHRDKLMLPDDMTIHTLFSIPKTEMLWSVDTGTDMLGDAYISISTVRNGQVRNYNYSADPAFNQKYLTLARYITAQQRLGNWAVEPNQLHTGYIAHRIASLEGTPQ